MGVLIVTHKGQTTEYLINTSVCEKAIDQACEAILKHYPQDAAIDFKELY
jgi:hypothetical protein